MTNKEIFVIIVFFIAKHPRGSKLKNNTEKRENKTAPPCQGLKSKGDVRIFTS